MSKTPDFERIVPTQFLKVLAADGSDLTDEAYDAMVADTRAALISLVVRPECALVFSEAAAEQSEPDNLYLGSHCCCDRPVEEPDAIYVELWARIDPDDANDFAMWNITTLEPGKHQFPISFCPFCGVELQALIRDYA